MNDFKKPNTVLNNHNKPKKYSEIFYDFMSPAIKEVIDDEKSLKKVLNWGQIIWNKVVAENFPNKKKCREIEGIFLLFKGTFHDKAFISEYLKRKREMFEDENFIIIKQTLFLDEIGRLNISVTGSSIGE